MIKRALALLFLSSFTATCTAACSSSSPQGGAGDGGSKSVVINELFAGGTSVTDPDWIELKNLTAAEVDVTGYQLRDNNVADLTALPAGTSIDAGGYLIIYCDDQKDGGVAGGVHVPWKLSAKKGDEVHVLDPNGVELDATTFGVDVPSDKSWGRLPDGTGAFIRTTPTQGRSNL